MNGWIYILQSQKNKSFYVGSSSNLERRLAEHNLGKCKYTSKLTPWKMVFSQKYETLATARKVELKLKQLKSKIILEKIIESGECKFVPPMD